MQDMTLCVLRNKNHRVKLLSLLRNWDGGSITTPWKGFNGKRCFLSPVTNTSQPPITANSKIKLSEVCEMALSWPLGFKMEEVSSIKSMNKPTSFSSSFSFATRLRRTSSRRWAEVTCRKPRLKAHLRLRKEHRRRQRRK